jgi:hypothetical protein
MRVLASEQEAGPTQGEHRLTTGLLRATCYHACLLMADMEHPDEGICNNTSEERKLRWR